MYRLFALIWLLVLALLGYLLYQSGSFTADGFFFWQSINSHWFDAGPVYNSLLDVHLFWALLLLKPLAWLLPYAWSLIGVNVLLAAIGAWQIKRLTQSYELALAYLLVPQVVIAVLGYDVFLFQNEMFALAFIPGLWVAIKKGGWEPIIWLVLCLAIKEEMALWVGLLLFFSGNRNKGLWVLWLVLSVANLWLFLAWRTAAIVPQWELLFRPRLFLHLFWVTVALLLPWLLLFRPGAKWKKWVFTAFVLILLRTIISTLVFGADHGLPYSYLYWGNTTVFVLLFMLAISWLRISRRPVLIAVIVLPVWLILFPGEVIPNVLDSLKRQTENLTPSTVEQGVIALPEFHVDGYIDTHTYVPLRSFWVEPAGYRERVLPQMKAFLVHSDSTAWCRDVEGWGYVRRLPSRHTGYYWYLPQ